MFDKLSKAPEIQKLALDLGLKVDGNVINNILSYCHSKILEVLEDFPDCDTLSDLLGFVSSKVKTRFEIITTDEELEEIKQKYISKREKAFVSLKEELAGDVFGITFKRLNKEYWESDFISVIDARGSEKASRAYFTKWHEIAHLLVLTDQMRTTYKRTHEVNKRNPEELLMDIIAGKFGFYAPLVKKHIKGDISVEAIENLRQKLCPESSQEAAFRNLIECWTSSCIFLQARTMLKKTEEEKSVQLSFDFIEPPTPVLRVAKVIISNQEQNIVNFTIYRYMRIPQKSVIYSVFNDKIAYGEAIENLSWWESDGKSLPECHVKVQTKLLRDSVVAIITPIR